MQFSKFAIFLVFSLTLAACGGKKSTTKATLVLGGLINSVAGQTGGTMVYLRQITGGDDNYAFKLPYSSDLELSNGLWRFAVVSWDGSGANNPMEGAVRCALSEVDLLGGGNLG